MVFSNFRENLHIIEPIQFENIKHFKQRIGFDYGWRNPSALVWAYVDYDGNCTIYDEWYGTQKTEAEINEASKKYGRIVTVADYSIKAPQSSGRSLWDNLERAGMTLIPSNKDELANITMVNRLLKVGRLKITRNCTNLIREILNYKWKRTKLGEEKNPYEETIDKDNHAIDSSLYLLASLEEMKTPDPKVDEFKRSIQYRVQKKDDNYSKQYS